MPREGHRLTSARVTTPRPCWRPCAADRGTEQRRFAGASRPRLHAGITFARLLPLLTKPGLCTCYDCKGFPTPCVEQLPDWCALTLSCCTASQSCHSRCGDGDRRDGATVTGSRGHVRKLGSTASTRQRVVNVSSYRYCVALAP